MTQTYRSDMVRVAYERNEIICGDDGYYIWWPSDDCTGALTEYDLRSLADELEEKNREWHDIVMNDPRIAKSNT